MDRMTGMLWKSNKEVATR